jgi:hypothetical protein
MVDRLLFAKRRRIVPLLGNYHVYVLDDSAFHFRYIRKCTLPFCAAEELYEKMLLLTI